MTNNRWNETEGGYDLSKKEKQVEQPVEAAETAAQAETNNRIQYGRNRKAECRAGNSQAGSGRCKGSTAAGDGGV